METLIPKTSRGCPRWQTERGFSILELIIAAGILALALMIAAQVLLESQRLMTRTHRTLVQSDDQIAAVLIRSDLRAASFAALPLTATTGAWQEGPLTLDNRSLGRVVYASSGSGLVREVHDEVGALIASRPVLQNAQSWRWRALSGRLIEVELGQLRETSPRGAALLLDRERRVTELQTVRLRGFLRDRGGRNRW